MIDLIRQAKSLYQYNKTVLPEAWAQLFHPYSNSLALARAKQSLKDRLTDGVECSRLNFIMAIPIVNWETTLIDHAKEQGDCHHIPFTARGFFESNQDWQDYRKANINKLRNGFDDAYQPDRINILFLYLSEFHIDPEKLEQFKQKNTIIVLFNWDDRLHYQSRHRDQSVGIKNLVARVDFCLSMAVSSLPRYLADGASVFYWDGTTSNDPQTALLPDVEFERVLFFGTRYGYREELIEYLLKKNLPLDVYGKGWGSEFISYDELEYKIPRYSVNLGISTIGYTRNLSCVKGRDIEVPSLGGLYLTNDNIEIRRVFDVGNEILTYKNNDDCYRKATKVLENLSNYSDIKSRGFLRSNNLTWKGRFSFLKSLIYKLIEKNEF
jgi:hypothetical protein